MQPPRAGPTVVETYPGQPPAGLLPAPVFPHLDRRAPVPDKGKAPYASIALVQAHFQHEDGVRSGTGFLVRPDLILTAAHVLSDTVARPPAGPSWVNLFLGAAARPPHAAAGVRQVSAADQAWGVHPQYLASGSPQHDIGFIRIAPVVAAPLPVRDLPSPFEGAEVLLAGFPTDRTPLDAWEHRGPLLASSIEGDVLHLVDSSDGQSGAPLLLNGAAVAVHRGPGPALTSPPRQANAAVRFGADIRAWIASIP